MRASFTLRFLRTALSALSLLLLAACGSGGGTPALPPGPSPLPLPIPQPPKAWTLLFYDDADFTPGYDPFEDFRTMVAETPDLNVLVLRDTYGGEANIYRINAQGRGVVVKALGEVNMGDGQTLADFTTFGKTYFPAERYIVTFYNHGSGWGGACIDDTSRDQLSMEEIRQGLVPLGKVDLLCFTAPCLMGAFESVYELRDQVKVYMGSENLSGFMLWFEALPWLSAELKRDPTSSNEALAKGLVTSIARSMRTTWAKYEADFTMCAARPEGTQAVVDALNALCTPLEADLATTRKTLDALQPQVQGYFSGWGTDLGDLLARVRDTDPRAEVKTRAEAALTAYRAMLVAEDHGTGLPGSTGLTVHFTRQSPYTTSYFAQSGLDFLQNSRLPRLLQSWIRLPAAAPAEAAPYLGPLVPQGQGFILRGRGE